MTARVQPDLSILLRRHHAAGKGVSYLARYFGLSRQTVHNIVSFRTHKNVVDIGQPLEVYEPIKTKPRAKSTPAPAPGKTLRDLASRSRYSSTSATPTPTPAAVSPSPTPPGPRPGDVRREPSPEPSPRPSTGGYSAGGLGGTPKGGF